MADEASRDNQSGPGEVSRLLHAWRDGDQEALQKLTNVVYAELHRLARRYMRNERVDHSLQPTALVNEAYLRLTGYNRIEWQDRAHFFAVSAQVMRRILVEYARRHNRKRGGGLHHVPFDENAVPGGMRTSDLVALDDVLKELERFDERKLRVVEMRFFGGLTLEETAAVLQLSVPTVMRDWNTARAWLRRELKKEVDGGARAVEADR
jgi:RNA polymerase sigma-70 factor, ECF subfamily